MSENSLSGKRADLKNIMVATGDILESEFKIDINKREKLVEGFFSEGYLPGWYFFSNSPETIAEHIYMLTHFINANTDMMRQAGSDGQTVTYFINVGRDYPGRLLSIIEENKDMQIAGYDSEITASGMRIVSIQKKCESCFTADLTLPERAEELIRNLSDIAIEKKYKYSEPFISALTHSYLREELSAVGSGGRVFRHQRFFEKALNNGVSYSERSFLGESNETRLSVALVNPGFDFITSVLKLIREERLNMQRSYYDLIESDAGNVGIMSMYFRDEQDIRQLEKQISIIIADYREPAQSPGLVGLEKIIRDISSESSELFSPAFKQLVELCEKNSKNDSGNFFLNAVTDFLKAFDLSGISKSDKVLKVLLGFDSIEEFFVKTRNDGHFQNKPGYRIRHSCLRGAAKGGLRIDNIVNFSEVAALSFMMSWKSARSGILFGGAKGGLMLNPKEFDTDSIDYFDTISSFGRSLFLVTGPAKDVPAGDVGCGGREIGYMFEGFKSALRDLALMVYGVKDNISIVGDTIISVEDARRILREAFNIDPSDRLIVEQLCGRQEYLELVAAAQITGKPRMGIGARTGATGRGLCYALLAAVANLYRSDKWESSAALTDAQESFLDDFIAVSESSALSAGGYPLESSSVAEHLVPVFTVLLKGKKLVVQGSGKVGSSIIKELAVFDVNLTAVSDAGGAVIGNNLDADAVLDAVQFSAGNSDPRLRASVVNMDSGFDEKIVGAAEGSAILELDCDILVPAALENAISSKNSDKVKASIVLCGSNGSNTSIAEDVLEKNGVTVVYDFLANGAGVTASYFEWLYNMNLRFKYEAEHIRKERYDISVMDKYIMPVYRSRIKDVLAVEESAESTALWNSLLRDIMISAVNEDFQLASQLGIQLKSAGFIRSQLRIAAAAVSSGILEKDEICSGLRPELGGVFDFYLEHPEFDK
jgi:glutamate dehydrogenase/leucine dehydrogenase